MFAWILNDVPSNIYLKDPRTSSEVEKFNKLKIQQYSQVHSIVLFLTNRRSDIRDETVITNVKYDFYLT